MLRGLFFQSRFETLLTTCDRLTPARFGSPDGRTTLRDDGDLTAQFEFINCWSHPDVSSAQASSLVRDSCRPLPSKPRVRTFPPVFVVLPLHQCHSHSVSTLTLHSLFQNPGHPVFSSVFWHIGRRLGDDPICPNVPVLHYE